MSPSVFRTTLPFSHCRRIWQSMRVAAAGRSVGAFALIMAMFLMNWNGQRGFAQEPRPAAGLLRYGWQAEQSLVYAVTIEADRGDYLDVREGTPAYTVQSANADELQLAFRGSLQQQLKSKPGKNVRLLRGPRSSLAFGDGAGQVTISRRGEVVSMTGNSSLPYLLGHLSLLMLETLPEGPEKTWEVHNDVAISEALSRLPRPRVLADPKKTTSAKETITYTVVKADGEQVVVKKTYHLKTAATVNGKPKFEISGSGEFVFDRKRGGPTKMDFQQRIVKREGNTTDETPLKFSYRLLDEAEREQLAIRVDRAGVRAAKPLDAAERDQVLADLKSNEQGRFLRRLLQLKTQPPKEPDAEMAGAMAAYLTHDNLSIRHSAASALEHWATEGTAPALLAALDDESPVVRHAAMNGLAAIKSERAAEPIAARLAENQDRLSASRALKALGPVAEAAVSKQADHEEWVVRSEVCQILAEIGTRQSIKTLERLANDPNRLVQQRARQALESVQKRS